MTDNIYDQDEMKDLAAAQPAAISHAQPDNLFEETVGEAPANPGASETIDPKTTPGRSWKDELMDGVSLDTARESARQRSRAEKTNPRMETQQEASLWGAAEHALGNQNIEAFANAMDHLGDWSGDPWWGRKAQSMRDSLKKDGSAYRPVYESYKQIGGLKDLWGYTKETIGQQIGVMAPGIFGATVLGGIGATQGELVGGKVGARVGGAIGGIAGVTAGTIHLHVSDMREALQREGVKGENLVNYTNMGATVLMSLDAAFPAIQAAKLGGFARRQVADKVAQKLVQNLAQGGKMRTAAEFTKQFGREIIKDAVLLEVPTELAQEAITELGAKQLAGKSITAGDVQKFATETAPEIALRTILGAGGMAMPGAGAQAYRDVRDAKRDAVIPGAKPATATGAAEEEGAPPPAAMDGTPAAEAALGSQPVMEDPSRDPTPNPATGATGNGVLQFIRAQGGLLPDGEFAALSADRIPGLVSENGKSLTEMRDALVEAGYLEESGPDQPDLSSHDDVYDLVQRAMSGERIVPLADRQADEDFQASLDSKDAHKQLTWAEDSIVLPAIEQYNEETGDPTLGQVYRKLRPDDRIAVIERVRDGEDVVNVVEEIIAANVDTEAVQAMVAVYGPNPELIERVRALLAEQQPDLLHGFDEMLAQFPTRRARVPREPARRPGDQPTELVRGMGGRLKAIAGDAQAFEIALGEMERDRKILKDDAFRIATDFLGKAPKKGTKASYFQAIRAGQIQARSPNNRSIFMREGEGALRTQMTALSEKELADIIERRSMARPKKGMAKEAMVEWLVKDAKEAHENRVAAAGGGGNSYQRAVEAAGQKPVPVPKSQQELIRQAAAALSVEEIDAFDEQREKSRKFFVDADNKPAVEALDKLASAMDGLRAEIARGGPKIRDMAQNVGALGKQMNDLVDSPRARILTQHAAMIARQLPNALPGQERLAGGEGNDRLLPNEPAIPVSKSVTPAAIVSLIDGSRHADLRTHLKKQGIDVEDYARNFRLADNYPLVAANVVAEKHNATRQTETYETFAKRFTVGAEKLAGVEAVQKAIQSASPQALDAALPKMNKRRLAEMAAKLGVKDKNPIKEIGRRFTHDLREAAKFPHIGEIGLGSPDPAADAARGEQMRNKALAEFAAAADPNVAVPTGMAEPAIPKGMVRVYHSGSAGEGQSKRWVSTNRNYGSGYRSDAPLFYMDLPETDARVNNPDYEDQGVKQGFTFNFELTPKEAAQLKEISRPSETQAPPAKRDLLMELIQLANSKTPRDQWGAILGVSPKELRTAEKAAIEAGILAYDKRGVARRSPEGQKLSAEGIVAEFNALLDEKMPTTRNAQGRDVPLKKAAENWHARAKAVVAQIGTIPLADAQKIAAKLAGRKVNKSEIASRPKIISLITNRIDSLTDSRIKSAATVGSAAMIAPGTLAGENVMLTPKAESKVEALQRIVDDAVAGILPAHIRADVVDNIEIGRLAREDELFALRSSGSDIITETEEMDDESVVEGGSAAGRKGRASAPSGAAPGTSARLSEGAAAARRRGDARLEAAGVQRIVRQESASLRSDGSVFAGRPTKGARTPAGRDAASAQRPGQTLSFKIDGFKGRVIAEELEPNDIAAGNQGRLLYRVFAEDATRIGENDPAFAEMYLIQHPDGAWEIEQVAVKEKRQGVGSKLYAAVETDLGIRMSPSGFLSPQGYAFWKKRSPESVKWHVQSPTFAGEDGNYYFSPRKIKDELSRIGAELRNVNLGIGRAANMRPALRDELIEGYRKERGELIKLWGKLPVEARAETPNMFSLRGFYSPAIRAAESISMKKGTGEQFWKQITKTPGVRKDELEWMGLEGFLASKKSITREEVLAFMRAHQVELDEKIASRSVPTSDDDEDGDIIDWARQESGAQTDQDLAKWIDEYIADAEAGRHPFDVDGETLDQFDLARQQIRSGKGAPAVRFENYKVPGGENYRELLIRLPKLEGKYTSKHFQDQEIVHLRVDDRTGPNGEKVLFINEVQSDLHQQGRQSGYGDQNIHAKAKAARAELRRWRDDPDYDVSPEREEELNRIIDEADSLNDETFSNAKIPNAPFKGDLWLELALKRALLYASENGYDAISWARSDQIAKAVGADADKLALQYDQKIGKFLDKYTKKWGGKAEEAALVDDATIMRDAETNDELMLEAAGIFPEEDVAGGIQNILRITPEMRAAIPAGQALFSLSGDQLGGGPQALGQTDPRAEAISISAKAAEVEARRSGRSTAEVAVSAARHEALEFFLATGLVEPSEWANLQRAARDENWIDETGVRQPYTAHYGKSMGKNQLEDLLLKEAIMEKYGRYRAGDYQPESWLGKIFKRITDFVDRIVSGFRKEGFETWEDIFQKVDQGALRRRYEEIYGRTEQVNTQAMIRAGVLPDARGIAQAPGVTRAPRPSNAPQTVIQRALGRARPIRALSELMADFQRAAGLSVRTGRIDPALQRAATAAGGQANGMYNGVARVRVQRDFDTFAHEAGHHLERTLGGQLRASMAAHSHELLPIASPVAGAGNTSLSEGFAEFFRRYLTNEQAARAQAPGFYRVFENLVEAENPRVYWTMQDIQDEYDRFLMGDPLDRGAAQQTVLRRPTNAARRFLADAERDGFVSTMADRLYEFHHGYIQNIWDKRHGWWMATRDLLDEVNRITGQRITLAAADNPNKLLRMTSHTQAWAMQDLKEGIALRGRPNGGGVSMHQVLATAFGGTARDQWNEERARSFGDYLIARRAVQLYVRFRPQSRQTIQAFVAANPQLGFLLPRLPANITSEIDRPPTAEPLYEHLNRLLRHEQQNPQFRQAAELYYRFNKDMIELLFEKGLITREEKLEYQQDRDYAPFQRDMSDRETVEGEGIEAKRPPRGRDKANKYDVYRRLNGSMRDIINPIQSTVQTMFEIRLRAAVNDTLAAMDRLARQAGQTGNEIFERLPPTEARATEVNIREQLRQAARTAGMSPTDTAIMLTNVESQIGQNVVTTMFTQAQASEKGEKIVWFFENGKPIPAQLPDGALGRMMFEGLTAVGQRNMGQIMAALTWASGAVRTGVTLSFGFMIRNIITDAIASTVNSPYARPVLTQASGLREVLRGGQYMQMYNRYAGMMGGSSNADMFNQSIERDIASLRQRGFHVRVPRSLKDFAKAVFQVGEFSETATRVGIFRNAMRSAMADGMSQFEAAVEAAHYAHDVLDFSQHGSKTEALRRTIPFFNAALQGVYKYGRVLTANNDYGNLIQIWDRHSRGLPLSRGEQSALGQAAKAWAISVVGLGAMSLIFCALGADDEDMAEVPDQIRATHWRISINGILYLLPKDIRTFLVGEDEKTDWMIRMPKPFEIAWFANAVERAWDYFVNNDPTAARGMAKDFFTTLVPPHSITGADLFYGFVLGRDMYSGNDIVPIFEKGTGELERSEQFGPYTTWTAKQIGDALNISPYYAEFLIRNLTASVGQDVASGIDAVLGEGPLPSIADYPVARRFTYNAGKSSESLSTFYNMMTEGEGLNQWFWNSFTEDARSFHAAGNTYGKMIAAGGENSVIASEYLSRINPDQRAYAILAEDFKGSGKSKYRNLHPMLNAAEGVRVTNAIMKEVVSGTLIQDKDKKFEEKKPLDREQMRFARNELGHIRKGLAQNALNIMGVDGWRDQKLMDVDARFKVLKAGAPEVYDELMRRLKKEKVQEGAHLAKVWPKVKERIEASRKDADLGDLYGPIVGE
jgi:hypothetical protein